ncbi:MAG: autotransporter outer membrane beta-barrel domain-containing protein [Spirochaetaceae bacterium]|jgi:hypothetical protein|nr:autotransporter outer membrane beta-barrel domain-containing protein [Spirochaetaceae bacterium]
MKKSISVVLLAAMVASGVFAQEEEAAKRKENAIFLDFGPLIAGALRDGFGLGVGYERALNDRFSILGHIDMLGFPVKLTNSQKEYYEETVFALDIDVRARWYPFKAALSGFFVGAGVGYGLLSDVVEPKSAGKAVGIEKEDYSLHIMNFAAQLGWKWILGAGFVLEPIVRYTGVIELANNRPAGSAKLSVGGFTAGVSLGWAF